MTSRLPLASSPPGDDGRSRYAVLAQALRQRVYRGEWAPGLAVPSEQSLARESGVALGTMRRALQVLADEGLIERVHGRGTFVREGLSGSSMLRFFRFGSGPAVVPGSEILSVKRLVPAAEVLRELGQAPRSEVLQLLRLRSLDGTPRLLETIWLPLPAFAALQQGLPSEWGDLLYPLYASRCGMRVHSAVDSISFGRLTATQARRLGLPAGHACAVVKRSAQDLAGRCIEVRVTRGDAQAFHYSVKLV